MSSFKIGILGCGAATKRYYVPAFKKFGYLIRDLYLIDKDLDLANDIKKVLGYGNVIDDYTKIIEKIQGIIVVLPNKLHFEVSMKCLEAGVHVLCEKPLAEYSEDVRKLNETAKNKNVGLCVNNTRRMFPSFQKVKEIISNGEIGQLKSIKFTEGNIFEWPSVSGFYVDPSVSSKGILSDVGPHVLDLVCWWLGGKLKFLDYKDDSFGGPESLIKFKGELSGCKVEVLLNRLNVLKNQFVVTGEKGTIEGELFEWKKLKLKFHNGEKRNLKLKTKIKNYPEFVIPIVENFIKVIQGTEKPMISGIDVLNSIDIIEKCYLSRTKTRKFHNKVYHKDIKNNTKTLITGASGFIGGSVVERLYSSNNRNIIAGIRQWSTAARLGRTPVEIVLMDLMDKNTIKNALNGVDEIIHCAKGSPLVTIQGTKNLLDAALKRKDKKICAYQYY